MRVVVAGLSSQEREQLRQAALSLGLECRAEDCLPLERIGDGLRGRPAGLALLSVGLHVAPALSAVHSCAGSATPVFVVTDSTTASSIPALLRAGAQGYLRHDELRTDLFHAVQQSRAGSRIRVEQGRVIAVTGGIAGVGVTTVATNIAFALAEQNPDRVALAQLTDGVPDLALNLLLSPTYSLADLAAGWYRLDHALIRRSLVKHPAGVWVLADQPGQTERAEWASSAMMQLLVLLRGRFQLIVLDIGHRLDPASQAVLTAADAVAVVNRLDQPSLRIGRDWLSRLREIGVSADCIVNIANRVGQPGQIPAVTAQEILAVACAESIPDDPDRVNRSLHLAMPVMKSSPTAPIGQSFARLARRWQGDAGRRKPASIEMAEAS